MFSAVHQRHVPVPATSSHATIKLIKKLCGYYASYAITTRHPDQTKITFLPLENFIKEKFQLYQGKIKTSSRKSFYFSLGMFFRMNSQLSQALYICAYLQQGEDAKEEAGKVVRLRRRILASQG
jgi:hypothetical protein